MRGLWWLMSHDGGAKKMYDVMATIRNHRQTMDKAVWSPGASMAMFTCKMWSANYGKCSLNPKTCWDKEWPLWAVIGMTIDPTIDLTISLEECHEKPGHEFCWTQAYVTVLIYFPDMTLPCEMKQIQKMHCNQRGAQVLHQVNNAKEIKGWLGFNSALLCCDGTCVALE